mgnify:CR=1 FL=1
MTNKKGSVLWFSGLSAAGKSTLSKLLRDKLQQLGHHVIILDGDVFRSGMCNDLGFSEEDRYENIRRVSHMSELLASQGIIVICALITPLESYRTLARSIIGPYFHNIYIKADISTCSSRDPKGLYQSANKGTIKGFTGISAPFEEPSTPDLTINTVEQSKDECLRLLLDYTIAVTTPQQVPEYTS